MMIPYILTALSAIFQPPVLDIVALFWGKIQFMWNFLEREKAGHTFSHTQTCRAVEEMLTHSTEINTTVKTYCLLLFTVYHVLFYWETNIILYKLI